MNMSARVGVPLGFEAESTQEAFARRESHRIFHDTATVSYHSLWRTHGLQHDIDIAEAAVDPLIHVIAELRRQWIQTRLRYLGLLASLNLSLGA